MAREAFCSKCNRTVYLSDDDDTRSCPVCSTPLTDSNGRLDTGSTTAEPPQDPKRSPG